MRTFAIFIIVFATYSKIFGQSIDSLGFDNNPFINASESKYLNMSLLQQNTEFDFTNKKVAFFIGSSNYQLRKKQEYFLEVKECIKNKTRMADQFLVLNAEQKKESGGYDVFIISWSKILVHESYIDKMIKKLKKNGA